MAERNVPVKGGVVAYLMVDGAIKAADFYVKALGAELAQVYPPDEKGRTMHAHLYINGSSVMLGDPFPEHGAAYVPAAGFNLMLPQARRGRGLSARRRCRLRSQDAARRHVLGRPLRPGEGSLRRDLGLCRSQEGLRRCATRPCAAPAMR